MELRHKSSQETIAAPDVNKATRGSPVGVHRPPEDDEPACDCDVLEDVLQRISALLFEITSVISKSLSFAANQRHTFHSLSIHLNVIRGE